MKKSLLLATVIMLSLAMSACDSRTPATYGAAPPVVVQPAYQQASVAAAQPVIIQQAAAPHSDTGSLLTGAAVGALAMHAMSGPSRQPVAAPAPVVHRTTVVNKTVVVNRQPARSSYRPPSTFRTSKR